MKKTQASRRWYVLQLASGGKIPERAATYINSVAIQLGQIWEVFIPLAASIKVKPEAVNWSCTLRYQPYIFASWPERAPWAELLTDEGKRAGIVDILRDGEGRPRPMPERAYEAMRQYRLPKTAVHGAGTQFHAGEPVRAYLAPGQPQDAVFIGYERGRGRPIVRIWIFGREMDVPVPVTAIEAKEPRSRIVGSDAYAERESDGRHAR